MKNKDTNFILKAQGNDYGICTVFYYNECMKVDNNVKIQTTMVATNHDDNENEDCGEEDSCVEYCK